MKISFVVPTRDSARTLDACLGSLRAQTHPDVEVIVVDNGSTDRTAQIARRHAHQFVEWGPERSAQRNKGTARSTGDVVVFIDSDMVLEPQVAAEIERPLRSGVAHRCAGHPRVFVRRRLPVPLPGAREAPVRRPRRRGVTARVPPPAHRVARWVGRGAHRRRGLGSGGSDPQGHRARPGVGLFGTMRAHPPAGDLCEEALLRPLDRSVCTYACDSSGAASSPGPPCSASPPAWGGTRC